jgi:cytochrome c oxidase assembly factor 3
LGCQIVAENYSIDSFTIKAVSQDDFEDVQVPDKPIQSPSAGAGIITNGPLVK